jgi:hypothetical protein
MFGFDKTEDRIMRIIILVIAIVFTATPSLAKISGCYERIYNAGELGRHPKQLITAMRLQIGQFANDDPERQDKIFAKFRKSDEWLEGVAICKTKGKKATCGIEADGGVFVVGEIRGGVRITNIVDMRFGDEEDGKSANPENDMKSFTLKKRSGGICP